MTKAVILAGGLGTRLSEETDKLPKPMVEIGDQPILWHIMKIYESYGINDFINKYLTLSSVVISTFSLTVSLQILVDFKLISTV